MTEPTAYIAVDPTTGEHVLHDPAAAGMFKAVSRHNCRATFAANTERIAYFQGRIEITGRSPDDVMIVIVNVDTEIGRPLADALMPGYDWQQIRDAGQIPLARGLATRAGIQEFLAIVDREEADRLRQAAGRVVVLVVDHGAAVVFDAVRMEPLR